MKPGMNLCRRRRTGAVMTEQQYREPIQRYVDRARSDQSMAEKLAEEARQRFGTEIEVSPPETE
jgi:hypothetical protein